MFYIFKHELAPVSIRSETSQFTGACWQPKKTGTHGKWISSTWCQPDAWPISRKLPVRKPSCDLSQFLWNLRPSMNCQILFYLEALFLHCTPKEMKSLARGKSWWYSSIKTFRELWGKDWRLVPCAKDSMWAEYGFCTQATASTSTVSVKMRQPLFQMSWDSASIVESKARI